jgi:hypothetical protein
VVQAISRGHLSELKMDYECTLLVIKKQYNTCFISLLVIIIVHIFLFYGILYGVWNRDVLFYYTIKPVASFGGGVEGVQLGEFACLVITST